MPRERLRSFAKESFDRLLAPPLLAFVLTGCTCGPPSASELQKQQPPAKPVGEEKAEAMEFECTWKDERHVLLEIGHNLPDAASSLELPEAERAKYKDLDNEDDLVIGDAHFVRAVAPFEVLGADFSWGLGLWVKISSEDFAELQKLGDKGHPPYEATVANQAVYGEPILGLPAVIRPASADTQAKSPAAKDRKYKRTEFRPQIFFADEEHLLTKYQNEGLPYDTLRGWLSDTAHDGEPEPKEKPFEADLEEHEWVIDDPRELEEEVFTFKQPPKAGDAVKALFTVVVSDEQGEPSLINAGWWVRLDDVSRDGVWSGTLDNYPPLPATIRYMSRVWVRPNQVVDYDDGTRE